MSGFLRRSLQSATRRLSPPESTSTTLSAGGQRSASIARSSRASRFQPSFASSFSWSLACLAASLSKSASRIAVGLADRLELGEHVHDLLHALAHDLLDRLARLHLRLLLEEADRVARRHGSLAEYLGIDPGEDSEEARLARSVEADDADLGAVVVREADVLEDHFRAVPLGDAVHGIDDLLVVEGSRHGSTIAGKAPPRVVAPQGWHGRRKATRHPIAFFLMDRYCFSIKLLNK